MTDKLDPSTDDVKNKVTIVGEDCDHIAKYVSHFKTGAQPDLQLALDAFKANPTYENMKEIKLQVGIWLTTCEHPSFKDSLWDNIKAIAEKTRYDLQFEKDVNNHLRSSDNSDSNN